MCEACLYQAKPLKREIWEKNLPFRFRLFLIHWRTFPALTMQLIWCSRLNLFKSNMFVKAGIY